MQKLAQFLRERLDLIVLLSCLLITYFIWSYGTVTDKTDHALVEDVTHNVQVVMTEEVENIFAFIDGVRGLYVASGEVTDDELSNYMSVTSQNHLSQAVLRMNFVVPVRNDEVEDKNMLVEGYENQYFVKQVIDKAGRVYKPDISNLLLDPDRRKMIDKLISGNKTVVMKVATIQNVSEYSGEGFIFIVPVYRDEELVGFVEAIVSLEKLAKVVEQLVPSGWDFAWYQDETRLIERAKTNKLNNISFTIEIEVGDADVWKIEIGKAKGVNVLWIFVLGAGVALSFLIYIVVYALNSASLRGLELGRAMNKDLQKYKLAIDSASNHIVITDVDGKILYANKAALNLTGYSKDEMLGQTPRLWGGMMGRPFYERFWDQIKNKRNVYSGIFENKRKNGEKYLAQATVSPIIDENDELLGFVGVEEDVTEERRVQRENKESLSKLAKFNELMVGRELKMVELLKLHLMLY